MSKTDLTIVFGDDGRVAGYASVSETGKIEALGAQYERLADALSEDEARSYLKARARRRSPAPQFQYRVRY